MADTGVRDVEVFLAFQRSKELYQKAHGDAPLVPALMLANAEFDAAIERNPDFAQQLEDGDLPWPPASPIGWPLKEWP
jgi:hypothetical protein